MVNRIIVVTQGNASIVLDSRTGSAIAIFCVTDGYYNFEIVAEKYAAKINAQIVKNSIWDVV